MTTKLQGNLHGGGLRIGIIVARFNEFVTLKLLEGTKAALALHGVRDKDVTVASVPGSFEIPLVAKKMAESRRFDAIICLGAVIKGDTDHYQYIAKEAARGIASAGLSSGVPVIFGVLTTDTVAQAIERSGGENGESIQSPRVEDKSGSSTEPDDLGRGNSGYNAGVTAIEMANITRKLDSY